MFKNGSLPVVLTEDIISKLLEDAHASIPIEIDLPKQVVRRSNGEEYPFQVDEFRKHCLINGLDEISLTMEHEADIAAFEERRSKEFPWLDGEFGFASIAGPALTLLFSLVFPRAGIGYRGKIPLCV